jgi:hypothetical protein
MHKLRAIIVPVPEVRYAATKKPQGAKVMRKHLAVLATLAVFAFPLEAQQEKNVPEQARDTASSQVLTPENMAAMRESAKAIGALFGVEQPKPQAAQPSQQTQADPAQDHKTMADVADKALNMVGQATGVIASAVEKAAPRVWGIMVRQQYATAFASVITPWGLVLIMTIFLLIVRKKYPAESGDELLWVTTIIPSALILIFAVWGTMRIAGSIQLLINPEYYAIRDLLSMVLKTTPGY